MHALGLKVRHDGGAALDGASCATTLSSDTGLLFLHLYLAADGWSHVCRPVPRGLTAALDPLADEFVGTYEAAPAGSLRA